MQVQKNTRRKRKDHESRDFTCKCGKSYLSYAAAYTHVKNKHSLEKTFLEEIGKPERQKLPRGRPRQKKESHNNSQIEQLSIIEQTILKIYNVLSKKFNKIILEGNTKQNVEAIEKIYNQLAQDKFNADIQANEQVLKFVNSAVKHFSAQISGRIKIVVVAISKAIQAEQGSVSLQKQRKIVEAVNSFDLWRGQNETNSILYQAFVKWMKIQS